MYLALTIASIVLHSFYVVTGKVTSTINPCFDTTWYEIITLVFMVAGLVCVVIAALKTMMRSNGACTSLPEFLCGKGAVLCIPIGFGQEITNN